MKQLQENFTDNISNLDPSFAGAVYYESFIDDFEDNHYDYSHHHGLFKIAAL